MQQEKLNKNNPTRAYYKNPFGSFSHFLGLKYKV